MARKPRKLSAEEADLWGKVAAATRPLGRAKTPGILHHTETKPSNPAPGPLPKFRIGETLRETETTAIDLAPTSAERLAAEPLAMDRKAFRKLSRGKMKPEATLDLHGMTLAEAHRALTGFILASHGLGRRLVLVITGKGRGGRDVEGPIPMRRGALKEHVPRWLKTAPCALAVLQVAQAHISHGGSGAYYVYLRRART